MDYEAEWEYEEEDEFVIEKAELECGSWGFPKLDLGRQSIEICLHRYGEAVGVSRLYLRIFLRCRSTDENSDSGTEVR